MGRRLGQQPGVPVVLHQPPQRRFPGGRGGQQLPLDRLAERQDDVFLLLREAFQLLVESGPAAP